MPVLRLGPGDWSGLAIKLAFEQQDIEIPFPHRTLYTGSQTAPMPFELVVDERHRNEAKNS